MSSENWRVIREYSGIGEVGSLYVFRIEDVYEPPKNVFLSPPNACQFVGHEARGLQVTGDTPERLRKRLKAMLAALDKPVLEYVPRELVEVLEISKAGSE